MRQAASAVSLRVLNLNVCEPVRRGHGADGGGKP